MKKLITFEGEFYRENFQRFVLNNTIVLFFTNCFCRVVDKSFHFEKLFFKKLGVVFNQVQSEQNQSWIQNGIGSGH